MSEAVNLPPMTGEPQTLPMGMITLGWTKALLDFYTEVLGMSGSYRKQAVTQSLKAYFVFCPWFGYLFLRVKICLAASSPCIHGGAIKHQDSTKEDFSLCRAVN